MKKQSIQNNINKNQLAIFENFKIRRVFDEKEEKWYFSVVDIVAALTDSINSTDYLKKLRKRDVEVGTYIGTNCPQIAETMQTKGLEENKVPAIKGGQISKGARKELEAKTGKSVVSGKNFLLAQKTRRK